MSRDLVRIGLALVAWGIGEGMFLYFQPLYLEELGASPIAIGNILSIVGVAMTVAHLPAGWLSARIGRRPLLIAAWCLGTTSAWIMALSRTLPMFVLGSALYGLTSFVITPLNSYLTTARGNMTVGRVLTLITAIYSVGAFLGPLLGGWLGNQFGLQINFLIAAFFFMASTSIIILIRPQPLETRPNGSAKQTFQGLLQPHFIRYLVLIFIVMFSLFLPQPLSQNFLQDQRGVNLAQIGVLISARSLGVIALSLGLGQLNPHIGFLLTQVAMALFTILIWRGGGFPWYLAGYFLMGSYQTARSLATSQGRALLNAANMNIGYGMIETAGALAAILAPSVAGRLFEQQPVFIYTVSLGLIGAAFMITILFSPSGLILKAS